MDKQLTDFIKTQQSQGISKEKITQDLLANKWEQQVIDEAFASLSKEPTDTAASSAEPVQVAKQDAPQQSQVATTGTGYKLSVAISDAVNALMQNPVPALLSLGLSVLISAVILSLPSLQLNYDFSENSSTLKNPGRLLTVAIAYFIVYAVVVSFINLMVSLAVYDGAEKKSTSIKEIASRAGSLFWRYIRVSMLLIAIAMGPAIAGLTISVLMIVLGAGAIGAILTVLISLASIVWIFIALFRYALLMSVAAFEPDVPIMNSPKRSRELLQNGGYEFLILGVLLYFGVTIVLSIVIGLSGIEKTGVGEVINNVTQTALSLVVQAVIVVFYRSRKALRG